MVNLDLDQSVIEKPISQCGWFLEQQVRLCYGYSEQKENICPSFFFHKNYIFWGFCTFQTTKQQQKNNIHKYTPDMNRNNFLHLATKTEKIFFPCIWDRNRKYKKQFPKFGTRTGNTRNPSCSLGREQENPNFDPVKRDLKGTF